MVVVDDDAYIQVTMAAGNYPPNPDIRVDRLADLCPPGTVPDPSVFNFPDSGKYFSVIERDASGVTLQFQDGRRPPAVLPDAHQQVIQERYPLARELVCEALLPSGAVVARLPSPLTARAFSRAHLQPLGATTLTIVQVPGGNQRAELIADCIAQGMYPVASEQEYALHDITDHQLGLLTLPEISTNVFEQISQAFVELDATDPRIALALAIAIAVTFDVHTGAYLRFCRPIVAGTEQPMLFKKFNQKLTELAERVYDGGFGRQAAGTIRAIVEATIPLPPGADPETFAGSKLEAWEAWEQDAMPAYIEAIHAKLQEQPPARWQQQVAGGLVLRELLQNE